MCVRGDEFFIMLVIKQIIEGGDQRGSCPAFWRFQNYFIIYLLWVNLAYLTVRIRVHERESRTFTL